MFCSCFLGVRRIRTVTCTRACVFSYLRVVCFPIQIKGLKTKEHSYELDAKFMKLDHLSGACAETFTRICEFLPTCLLLLLIPSSQYSWNCLLQEVEANTWARTHP